MSSSKPFTAPADGDELPEGKKHSPPLRIPQNQNPIQQESQTSITSRSSELVLGSIDERIFHLQKDEGTPSASFNLAGNRPQQDCPDIVQKDEASATLLPQAEKEDGEEQEELPLLFPQIDEEDERELRHRATSPFQVEKEDKGKKVQEAPLSPQDAPPPTPSLASSEATSKPSSHKTQGTQSEASSAALPQHESPINDKETLEYKSHEKREQLHKDNLCQTGKKFHTSSYKIPVKVDTKEEVMVEASVCPRVSDNNTLKAVLDVRVFTGKNLLKRLRNSNAECEIKVETEVLDNYTRQNIGSTQFHMHAMNMDDGKVTFRQDLAPCEAVHACRSSSVTLVFKATFVTTVAKQNYTISEHEEFGVIEIGDQ